jgi:hypothetical protein
VEMAKAPNSRLRLVLVSGSAEDGRAYTPVMDDPAGARNAAELVGAALAKNGCRIAVFSAEPQFIEHAVVKGFVGALKSTTKKGRAKRIEIRAPLAAQTAFAERIQFDDIFVDLVDQEAGWRRAFIRTLAEADAALLVGGERMTAAIGHAAVAFRIPVLSLAGFGGTAQEVWRAIPLGDAGPSDSEHAEAASRDWTAARAERCVTALLAQIDRREKADQAAAEAERKQRFWISTRVTGGAFILVAAFGLVWGSVSLLPAEWANLMLYLVGPIGGCGAALAASSFQDPPPHGIMHTGALGLIAGVLTAAIYLLAQMSAKQFEPTNVTFLLACLTGIGGGFTAERVIRGWMAGKGQLLATRRQSS